MAELPAVGSVWGVPSESISPAHLIAWLRDPHRKPPELAFTSGPERLIADLALAMRGNSMTCSMCSGGYAGRCPATGEANDCHCCDGNGNITAEMFVAMKDRCEEMVGNAMYRDIVATEEAETSLPFTVDWLVEIGGHQFARPTGNAVYFTSPTGAQFDYHIEKGRWLLGGANVPAPITTRADVLRWLDVLGIVPTAKGA